YLRIISLQIAFNWMCDVWEISFRGHPYVLLDPELNPQDLLSGLYGNETDAAVTAMRIENSMRDNCECEKHDNRLVLRSVKLKADAGYTHLCLKHQRLTDGDLLYILGILKGSQVTHLTLSSNLLTNISVGFLVNDFDGQKANLRFNDGISVISEDDRIIV
ncbi:unnamed protein product, partial [marine sediment metagenome]